MNRILYNGGGRSVLEYSTKAGDGGGKKGKMMSIVRANQGRKVSSRLRSTWVSDHTPQLRVFKPLTHPALSRLPMPGSHVASPRLLQYR